MRESVLPRLQQLQVQHQSARGAVFQRRIPHLNHAPERDIEPDHFTGLFHGGKKILSLPKAGRKGGDGLTINIALSALPVTLEVFALELFFESLKCFGHE